MDMDMNFYNFIDVLENHGWNFHDFQDGIAKGKEFTKFYLHPDNSQSSDFSMLLQDIESALPDFDVRSYNYASMYAPEQSNYVILIIDK